MPSGKELEAGRLIMKVLRVPSADFCFRKEFSCSRIPRPYDGSRMSGKAVNFGLVGFGAWGRMHAQSIAMNREASLVGITAPSEASRAEAAQLFPTVKVFADHREMLATC